MQLGLLGRSLALQRIATGIAGNNARHLTADFSTRDNPSSTFPMVAALLIVVAILGAVAFLLKNRFTA